MLIVQQYHIPVDILQACNLQTTLTSPRRNFLSHMQMSSETGGIPRRLEDQQQSQRQGT